MATTDQGIYANAMSDTAFKIIFQNEEVMMDLLNGYIPDRKIMKLEFINTEIQGSSSNDRRATVDVLCTDDKGARFVVEMQNAPQKNFRERMIFYASRIISERPEAKGKGWDYSIPSVYVLAFTAFSFTDVIQDKRMQDVFTLNYITVEKTIGDRMPHAPEYFLFDLGRFNKKLDEVAHSPEKWLYLLRNSSKLKTMPQEFKGDPAVEKYFTVSELAAFSEAERESYYQEIMNRWDIANAEAFLEEKIRIETEEKVAMAHEEGIAEGEKRKNLEIAKAMLANGIDVSIISSCTGLSEEEIRA